MMNFRTTNPRGFTLLISMIFTSVVLSVGLALMDVAYKQAVLVAASRQSEYAFYNADSAMECALEQDQVFDTFDYSSGATSGTFMCEGQTVTYTNPLTSPTRTATFSIPCTGGGSNASTTVYKKASGAVTTTFYTDGFNDCDPTNIQRLERGLQAKY